MYSDKITLYNQYIDNGVLKWKTTVFNNVDLNVDKANIIRTYGENSNDLAKLHIRFDYVNGSIVTGGNTYKEPMEYTGASNTFTFRSGEDFDFFRLGEDTTASYTDSDYTDGFYNHMLKNYEVYAITGCAIYSVIPHFEVRGK